MFLEKFRENLLTCNDKKALICSDGTSYTYKELEEISGKVSAWLKDQEVGKEDTVLITMPRGLDILAAMVGVIRAGACFVICESSMANERIRFIMENSRCRKVIMQENWHEIMEHDYSPDFAEPDPHDAAYIVYTSGTTGTPKGVVHEYGNYDQSVMSKRLNGVPNCQEDDVLGMNSPLNFVAAVDYTVNVLYAGAALLLVEINIVKNVSKLMELYEKEHVSYTFMTPSLYRSIPNLSPSLKKIQLGGETTVGLYNDKIQLINGYNMSEAGRDMLLFPIDRKYTSTPVGHNQAGEEVYLLGEDGKPVADGEIGEVCFPNEYVRGYLGLPEKTKAVWRDGLFHTGDLGRCEGGEICLLGRNDDMIKINGNRIEPAEIETVAKKVLGLSQVIVKGFVTPERNFIVLYYTDDVVLDAQQARRELSRKLTSYMLPSYFVHLDEVPLLPSGKINKKALEAPSLDSYRKEYEAPETDTEKELTVLFEKILGIEHIGVNDDFYELGGDSLKSIELIMEYNKDSLDAQTVFKCRTVRRIAREIELNLEEMHASGIPQFDSPADKERAARAGKYPLTEFQTNMFDYQLFEPWSTMWNLEDMFSFDLKDTDPEKLYQAVRTAADNASIFRTKICFDECCDLVQYIDENAVPAVDRIILSDQEFENIKNTLNHPFRMIGGPFIETKVFLTETKVVLHFLAHHMVIDGKGMEALFENIAEVYKGREPALDTYYSFLMDREQVKAGRKYREARQYFESVYGRKKWFNCPKPDHRIKDHDGAVVSVKVPVIGEKLESVEKKAGLTRSGLTSAVLLLAMAEESHEDNVLMSWVYHRRTDLQKKHAIGLLISQLPIGVTMSECATLADLYAQIKEKVNAGIANSSYEWCLNNSISFEDDMMLLAYEGEMFQWGQLSVIGARPVPLTSQFGASEDQVCSIRKIFTMAVEDREGISLNLTYLKNAYSPEHIGKLQELTDKYAKTVFSDADPASVKIGSLLEH